MRKIILRCIFSMLSCIWILFIFYMSSKPGSESSNISDFFVGIINKIINLEKENDNYYSLVSFSVRKCAHIFEFFLLSLLLYATILQFIKRKYNFIIVMIIAIFIAVCDEYIQSFIPGRVGTYIDVFIDTIGILIAIMICLIIENYVWKNNAKT